MRCTALATSTSGHGAHGVSRRANERSPAGAVELNASRRKRLNLMRRVNVSVPARSYYDITARHARHRHSTPGTTRRRRAIFQTPRVHVPSG